VNQCRSQYPDSRILSFCNILYSIVFLLSAFTVACADAIMPGGLHPPLATILQWSPNYVNPETRGIGIVILVVLLLALTYVVVLMRLWARLRMAKNAGVDDALIVFNMVSWLSMC
jgi:hypothetical protein